MNRLFFFILIVFVALTRTAFVLAIDVIESGDSLIVKHPLRSDVLKLPPEMQGDASYSVTILPHIRYQFGGTDAGNLSREEVQALIGRAQKAFQDGNLNDALEFLSVAFSSAPQNTRICNMLGSVYFKLGDFDQARTFWQQSLEISPGQARVKEYLGRLPQGSASSLPTEKAATP